MLYDLSAGSLQNDTDNNLEFRAGFCFSVEISKTKSLINKWPEDPS